MTEQNLIKSPEGTCFTHSAISQHLKALGNERTALSLAMCGSKLHGIVMINCSKCDKNKVVPLTHRCNLRICDNCSQTRKKRIKRDYLPILNQFKICNEHQNKSSFGLRFLTISPQNYDSFEEGIEDCRKFFQKFIRRKYVKDRIKGYIYCIEVKKSDFGNWNVHLHAIILSKFLDNRVRGNCLDCGQNLLKREDNEFYCANRSCNSKNVAVFNEGKSKLLTEVEDSFLRPTHIDIKLLNNQEHVLSYLLKYVSINKSGFSDAEEVARYVNYTHKQKLIVRGLLFGSKVARQPIPCVCGGHIIFTLELEIILYESEGSPKEIFVPELLQPWRDEYGY